MTLCLYCHQSLNVKTSWRSFLIPSEAQALCTTCQQSLQPLGENICKICGRALVLISNDFYHDHVCIDCQRWEQHPIWKGCLIKNRSLYIYNDTLKEILSQFKFRGDYLLIKAFELPLKKIFQSYYHDYLVIPIPLSEERLYERSFNQAEAIASLLDVPYYHILSRTHSEKQSKKSREERLQSFTPFKIKDRVELTNKKVLLVDDIYTTGTTLRQAAKVLHSEGVREVASLTLAR